VCQNYLLIDEFIDLRLGNIVLNPQPGCQGYILEMSKKMLFLWMNDNF
jgi:hypothetical protein